jgi:hypothetical protein
VIPDDVKALVVQSEGDVQIYGAATARDTGGVVYEVAGTSHAPGIFLQLPNGNRTSHGPPSRALMLSLVQWVRNGVEPPPGALIEVGEAIPLELLPGLVIPAGRVTIKDAFGNALGGVRLPHVEVPLGVYSGYERCPMPFDPVSCDALASGIGPLSFLAGHFVPFSAETLDQLYPSHGAYVRAVRAAARRALDARWILRDDYDVYVREAARSDVGK